MAANTNATSNNNGCRCCAFMHNYICPWFAPDHALKCDAGAVGAVVLASAIPNALGFAGMHLGKHRLAPLEWFKQLRKPDCYPTCGASGAIWATLTVLSAASYLRVLTATEPHPGECKCLTSRCLTRMCPCVCNEPEPAEGPAGDGERRKRAAKAFLMQALLVNGLWGAALFGARSPTLSFAHTLLSIFATLHAAGAAYAFDRTAGLLMAPVSLWLWAEAALGYGLMKRNVCGAPNWGDDKVCGAVCKLFGCTPAPKTSTTTALRP